MKKFLLILLSLFVSFSCTYAQIGDKPSWWKTGELRSDSTTKKSVTVIGTSMTKLDSTLQLFVKESLFILRQDYSLYDKRKKKFYGFNDQEQFGTTYSLGIKCKQFNVILDEAVRPWRYDENYLQFKSDKLMPVITASKYLLLNDSITALYNNLDSIVLPRQTIKENAFYASKPFTNSQGGIEINIADTCSCGYLVWILKEDGRFEKGNVRISLKTVKTNIDMVGNITLTPPTQSSEILGALFLTSNDDSPAKFYLGGIATKEVDEWILHFPFKGFELRTGKQGPKASKGRLTEIKKGSKK